MRTTNNSYQTGTDVSLMGYKDNSPYKNSPYLDILSPSGRISMKGVSKPLLAITNQGERTIMLPENEYKFNSKLIREIPMKYQYQMGGQPQSQQENTISPGDLIAAYIQLNNLGQKEAEQIYQSFSKMSPEDKQIFLQNITNEIKEAQESQNSQSSQSNEQMIDPNEQNEMSQGQEVQMNDGSQMMMVGGIPILTPSYYPGHRKMQVGIDNEIDYEYGNEGVQTYNYKSTVNHSTKNGQPGNDKKISSKEVIKQKQNTPSVVSPTTTNSIENNNLDLATSLNQNLQEYQKIEDALKNKYIDTGKEKITLSQSSLDKIKKLQPKLLSDNLELIGNYYPNQLGVISRAFQDLNSVLYDKQSKSFVARNKEGKYTNIDEDQLYKIYTKLSDNDRKKLLKYSPNIDDKLINTYFK